jgi:hypothetical protein
MRIRVLRRRRLTITEGPATTLSEADAVTLIYELLDAHQDTTDLAEEVTDDARWAAHLDYLRALQRTGREILARMPAGEDRG